MKRLIVMLSLISSSALAFDSEFSGVVECNNNGRKQQFIISDNSMIVKSRANEQQMVAVTRSNHELDTGLYLVNRSENNSKRTWLLTHHGDEKVVVYNFYALSTKGNTQLPPRTSTRCSVL
jgi:hypothetical protein